MYNKIVIIQGETANKNFMHAYGYDKPTTPFLSSLHKKNELTLFNAIAPSNQTRYSVPMIFTKANVQDWHQNYTHSASILTYFREYGYKTFWISNQGQRGEHEDYITNIAMEADITTFLNHGVSKSAHSDRILSNFVKNQTATTSPEVYVLHLMGSHFAYRSRYERKDALFTKPKNIIEEYENTIYLTDFIIKDIYKYFNRDGNRLLLVYLSDHGEVVNLEKHGHGLDPTYADEYDIPLAVFSNIENERINELKQDNINHTINAESINNFIMYITGLDNNKSISYSDTIFSLDPENKYSYHALKYYK